MHLSVCGVDSRNGSYTASLGHRHCRILLATKMTADSQSIHLATSGLFHQSRGLFHPTLASSSGSFNGSSQFKSLNK